MGRNEKHPHEKAGELEGAGLVVERAMFYRDGYRGLMRISIYLGLALAGALVVIALLIYMLNQKEHKYFGMSPTGSIVPMVPYSEPTVSDARMLQVVGDVATCMFTYDYVNWRSQLLDGCRNKFTNEAWDKIVTELAESKMLKLVTGERLVLSATRINSPVVVDRGIINGVRAWKIEVPIRVTYSGRQNIQNEDYLVKMTVVRANQTEFTDGLAISSFVAPKM
ncbi:DotI/IcmL family type IV secretion protein [Methylobacillus sp. Pita2]|uniref:DotI/IcmL family type IV secretion protein n=1 Tax=Methylobacillus sp. Pita2 TaxID=3383245 RepID=UPI0038B5D174